MGCPLAGELEKGPREWARRRWTDRWGRRGGRCGVELEDNLRDRGGRATPGHDPGPWGSQPPDLGV